MTDFDIAIIGAGFAGIGAAAAAGPFARVLLLEASSALGGSATAAMHRCLCGLYAELPTDPLQTLNPFVQRDLVRRMLQKDPAAVIARQMGAAPVLEFPQTALQSALADICRDSSAHLQLNSRLTGVLHEGRRITAIRISSDDQRWISIRSIIDCSGAGQLLRLLGPAAHHPPEEARDRMLAGYAIRITGIKADPEMLRLQIPFELSKAVAAGTLPPCARFTFFHPGPKSDEGICKLAVDPAAVSQDEVKSLAQAVFSHLISKIPGLVEASIAETSPRILPRLGLRLRGRHTVTEQDVLHPREHMLHAPERPPLSVRAWWPMERWETSSGPSYIYPPPSKPYLIPSAALQSEPFDNLFAAGMCLSATAGAAASTRASGICLATGYAAGQLALEQSVS